jgi:hypothetical protein
MNLWHRLEYGFHMADAYLALHRGDTAAYEWSWCRAQECLARIDRMRIQ